MSPSSKPSSLLSAILQHCRARAFVTQRSCAARTAPAAIALALAAVASPAAAVTIARVSPFSSARVTATGIASIPGTMPLTVVRAIHVPKVEGVAFLPPASPLPIHPPLAAIANHAADCWNLGGKEQNSTRTSINNDDTGRESTTISYSRADCTIEIRAEGKFTLRSDLTDVETLASGGWIRIEERTGRESRRLEISASPSGTMGRVYYRNGTRTELDAEGRAWLARTLLAVERRTAFAADTRVPQLWKEGGVSGVLAEISRMPSEHAASRYYSSLVGMDVRFDTHALGTIIRQATADLAGSDYYLSQMLGRFAAKRSLDGTALSLFADAAARMKSDYYKSQIIGTVLGNRQLALAVVGSLLRAASTIDSDYYLSQVLRNVAGEYATNDATRQYYADALRTIDSDYYRRQVLTAMNTGEKGDARTSALVVTSVADMKSDYEKSQSLISLANAQRVSDWPGYFRAATNMESDHYVRQTLEAALKHKPLTREIVTGVLSAALKIRSDSYLSELLTTVANAYPIDDAVRPAYDRAIDAIESDHYRGQVLVATRRRTSR